MGLSRQGVQKTVDRLVSDQLVCLAKTPRHKISPLVKPTADALRLEHRISTLLAEENNQDAKNFSSVELERALLPPQKLSQILSKPNDR